VSSTFLLFASLRLSSHDLPSLPPSRYNLGTYVSDDHISHALRRSSVTALDPSDRSFKVCEEGLVDEDDGVDVAEESCGVIGRDDGHRRVSREQS